MDPENVQVHPLAAAKRSKFGANAKKINTKKRWDISVSRILKKSHTAKFAEGLNIRILFRFGVKNVILYTCFYFLWVIIGPICACSANICIQYIKSCYPSVGIII